MKSSLKNLTTIFPVIIVMPIICLSLFLVAPTPGQAAIIPGQIPDQIPFDTPSQTNNAAKQSDYFAPQVQGLDYEFKKDDKSTGNIARYIQAIYKYAIGIVGILAAVVLMVGGVLWIIAGGNSSQISEAKAWITAALTGLILALTSYLILYTVNPALVNLKTINISKVEKPPTTGCCVIKGQPEDTYEEGLTEEDCSKKTAFDSWQKGQTCPMKCCAWGHVNDTNFSSRYKYCESNSNITETACKARADQLTDKLKIYKPNGKCEKEITSYGDNYNCITI